MKFTQLQEDPPVMVHKWPQKSKQRHKIREISSYQAVSNNYDEGVLLRAADFLLAKLEAIPQIAAPFGAFLDIVWDAMVGKGSPILLWVCAGVFFFLIQLLLPHATVSFSASEAGTSNSMSILNSIVGSVRFALLAALHLLLFLWLAPLGQLGRVLVICEQIRSCIPTALLHFHTIAPHIPTLFLYRHKLFANIDIIAPFLSSILEHSDELFPHLPVLMDRFDDLLPFIPKIAPKLDLLAPYLERIVPHIDNLLPHINDLLPYTDNLLPHINTMLILMEVPGWEVVIPYIGVLEPYLPDLAPHAEAMAPHFPAMIKHLPILVKYVHNLAPNVDETVEVLDRLMPVIVLLPFVDRSKLLYSKKVCKALPKFAHLLPKRKQQTLEDLIDKETWPSLGEKPDLVSEQDLVSRDVKVKKKRRNFKKWILNNRMFSRTKVGTNNVSTSSKSV